VSCDNGVLSGFEFVKDGSGTKYRYDYECTQGGAASGELLEKTVLPEGGLSDFKDLTDKDSFGVACDVGALANFRVLPGTGDSASYEYTCRDIGVSDEEPITKSVTKDLTGGQNVSLSSRFAKLGKLTCDDGSVLSGFNYSEVDNDTNKYTLSGICKKLSI